MANATYWFRSEIRVRALSVGLLCVPTAQDLECEPLAAWACRGSCDEERNLRMLCLERVGSHRRTGEMSIAMVLDRAQRFYDFAMTRKPDKPGRLAPVPHREDRSDAPAA